MGETPAEKQRGGALEPHRPAATSEDAVEAEIDREVDASFPASDPPGWTTGIEARYGQEEEEAPKQDAEK
jgi:hypothetical protein